MNLWREQLSKAARMRTSGARKLLGNEGGDPQLACYLLHVSLECALKLRILRINNKKDLESLKHVMPVDDYRRLFQSSDGHNMEILAVHSSLRRFLAARQQSALLDQDAWRRIVAGARPYSLRYGAETVERKHASEEFAVVTTIVDLIVGECT